MAEFRSACCACGGLFEASGLLPATPHPDALPICHNCVAVHEAAEIIQSMYFTHGEDSIGTVRKAREWLEKHHPECRRVPASVSDMIREVGG